MLPTDQSRLIELRFAVLRPANDRRDISAASGVFARQCGRVSAEKERVPCTLATPIKLRHPQLVPARLFFLSFFRKLKASLRQWSRRRVLYPFLPLSYLSAGFSNTIFSLARATSRTRKTNDAKCLREQNGYSNSRCGKLWASDFRYDISSGLGL